MRHIRTVTWGGLTVLVSLLIVGMLRYTPNGGEHVTSLRVVAAENFWGSLAEQIGGSHITVSSIASDPNADPHEIESNTITARRFATASYVILNGAGYDTWGEKLLNANPRAGRMVLNVATLLGKQSGDNPHFWYDPTYVNAVVVRVSNDLSQLDPADSNYFAQRLQKVQASLHGYQQQIANIRHDYANTPVGATEDIFTYLAAATGLRLASPSAFMQAVAEGNDPPTASVSQLQNKITEGDIKVLVYNKQTITPLTENIRKMAVQHHIPIVGITETVQPENARFQDWMDSQITALQSALTKATTTL